MVPEILKFRLAAQLFEKNPNIGEGQDLTRVQYQIHQKLDQLEILSSSARQLYGMKTISTGTKL